MGNVRIRSISRRWAIAATLCSGAALAQWSLPQDRAVLAQPPESATATLDVVLIGDEDRRALTTREARRFSAVGRIWNDRHGYAAAVFLDRAADQKPVTASLLVEPIYAVTAAHFFYRSGALKRPLEEIRFGHGDFRTEDVQSYRIVDIEAGTTYPDRHSERDFAIVRLDRPASADLSVLALRRFDRESHPPPRLYLVAYHGDIEGGARPRISSVQLEEKSSRRLEHGARWYAQPEILIYGGNTEGGSSGAPLIGMGDDAALYLEALNLGYIRCTSWKDGHGFSPVCHFNYGIAITGHRAFYYAFRRLAARYGAP